MPKIANLEELISREEKLTAELKKKQDALRSLKYQKSELERKKRTRRLCSHGGQIEYYLPPEKFSDEEFERILGIIFHRPEVIEILNESIRNRGRKSIKKETDAGQSGPVQLRMI